MIAWMGLNIVLAVVRTRVCNRMARNIDNADTAQLRRNEQWLFATALSSTTALGSGFWWLCLGGTDKVVLAVTLLSCIYGIGTTVNSAIHDRGMPRLLVEDNHDRWSGDHCIAHHLVPGILVTNRRVVVDDPALTDVAPTILGEFGVETPSQMTGRPLFSGYDR